MNTSISKMLRAINIISLAAILSPVCLAEDKSAKPAATIGKWTEIQNLDNTQKAETAGFVVVRFSQAAGPQFKFYVAVKDSNDLTLADAIASGQIEGEAIQTLTVPVPAGYHWKIFRDGNYSESRKYKVTFFPLK